MVDVETGNSSEVAASFFKAASLAAPSSYAEQGLGIASRCIANNLNPNELKVALLNDGNKLENIRSVAHTAHTASGRGPVDMPLERVRGMVEEGFDLAGKLIKLSPDQLTGLQLFVSSLSGRPAERLRIVIGKFEEVLGERVFF